jgi:hypothetical protein
MLSAGAASMACVLLLAGCVGGGDSCGRVQPCGGDVAGDWTIAGMCGTEGVMSVSSCPAATGTASETWSGTLTFDASMTYATNLTVSGTASVTYPQSCLTASGVTLSCAQLGQGLQMELMANPGMFQSAHCTGTSSCVCTLTLDSRPMMDSGTYTTSGTQLATSGTLGSRPYCVKGSDLHLLTVDATAAAGPIGSLVITGDLVATRH